MTIGIVEGLAAASVTLRSRLTRVGIPAVLVVAACLSGATSIFALVERHDEPVAANTTEVFLKTGGTRSVVEHKSDALVIPSRYVFQAFRDMSGEAAHTTRAEANEKPYVVASLMPFAITRDDDGSRPSAQLPLPRPNLRLGHHDEGMRSLASLPDPKGEGARTQEADDAALGAQTAVYDIKARVVHMPNGDRLEAHSGMFGMRDDPRYIKVRMHGPTPPNVYKLSMRERSFHGVEAIRLTPLGQSEMFGRDGMLAHPYMLGPEGNSNGCVSFKEYDRFLQAFKKGEVTRLVVVPDRKSSSEVAGVELRGGGASQGSGL